MMPVAYPRRIAALLLRFAIWIAPHDILDWSRGMLSELNHVQGNWAVLIWAVGAAGVLAKRALLSVILPGSHRRLSIAAFWRGVVAPDSEQMIPAERSFELLRTCSKATANGIWSRAKRVLPAATVCYLRPALVNMAAYGRPSKADRT
jgi:hypothetical protein